MFENIGSYLKPRIKILLNPGYWIMLHVYLKELDELVNKLLDEKHVIEFDEPNCIDNQHYHAGMNGVWFWIQNYPYAYGSLDVPIRRVLDGNRSYNNGLWFPRNARPSRVTIIRLHEAIQARKKELRKQA
jgi:hypothetical protein